MLFGLMFALRLIFLSLSINFCIAFKKINNIVRGGGGNTNLLKQIAKFNTLYILAFKKKNLGGGGALPPHVQLQLRPWLDVL